MTAKPKKAKQRKKAERRKARPRREKVLELRGSVEDDLFSLAEERGTEARWNRPRKQRISLRVDTEVIDWFKSKGPGYQTRMNRILRRVMMECKQRAGER